MNFRIISLLVVLFALWGGLGQNAEVRRIGDSGTTSGPATHELVCVVCS